MRREDMVLFAVLTVGCFVVPAALGAALHLPVAVVVLVVFALLIADLVSYRWLRFARQQRALRDEEAARLTATAAAVVEEPVDHGRRMTDVPLPCAEPGYRFLLSATVFWRPAPNPVGMRHTNPEALALESIRARAGQLAADQAPGDHLAVGYQLAAALGTVLPDGSGQVVAWANDVVLRLPEDDEVRLRTITQLRKQEQVWDAERAIERTMRAYLRDEVLESPGSAIVWWLARHPDQVEDSAGLIGPLAQLSAAARGTPVHELVPDFLPRQAIDSPDGAQALADELFDLAGRLRHTHGIPEGPRRLDR
ncbi:MAG TPA: hypothetical protein VHV74_06165 [Pseudonocardiaceae bacterium]|jgi:hypothetical protein|nr:hypothetical protein [Pseudonocardiaceae bacterium]